MNRKSEPRKTSAQANAGTQIACKRPQFHLKPYCVAVLLAFAAQPAQANPSGGEVVSGQASFTTSGDTLTVTNSPNAIINWQNFSIGANESVNFNQPSVSSTVFVYSNNISILGTLQSNGSINLVTPGDITAAGSIITGNLTLSTGTIVNTGGTLSLANGTTLVNTGTTAPDGTIINTGTSTSTGGTITIGNGGTLSLANGTTLVNTGTTAPGGTVINTGTSTSTGGTITIGNGGTISITGLTTSGGLAGFSGSSIANANTGTIIVTDEMRTSWNGATLVNAGTFTATAGLTGSYANGIITLTDVTSAGGSIAVGNGIFLSSTAQNTVVATLGLGGPRLPAASILSNPVVFSSWLNNNGLVTHTQLASIGTLVRSGLNSVLFGSHHRILRDNGMTNTGSGFWATGDLARHDPNNTDAAIGEFGVYKDIAPSLRLGAGAGANQARQGLPLNGSGKLDSSYLVVEGDYQSLATGWVGSATVYLGSNHASISRGYMIGITPNLSSGDANGSSLALRLRSDWSNITSVKGWNASPYLAYTHAESRLDGYTETGGTLPITFAAQKQTSDELRGGVTLLSRLSEQTDLRFPLELAHRSNGSTMVTGVAAANPFSFSNAGSTQDWGRVGIELDHRMNNQTVLNGAALYASRGGDSSWLATVSLKHAF